MVAVDTGPVAEGNGERIIALEVIEECRCFGVPCQRHAVLACERVYIELGVEGERLACLLHQCERHVFLGFTVGDVE